MTQTINVTQEILDSLLDGDHVLKVVATTARGFSAEDSATFYTTVSPTITVDANLGEHGEGFSFDVTIANINYHSTMYGYLDGELFYQLNYGENGTYEVTISDNVFYSLAGGEHNITFTLTDKRGKSASASSKFEKMFTLPVFTIASDVGDRTGGFSIPITIKNALSEHPSMDVYIDTTTTATYHTDDASQIDNVTITEDIFLSLDDGAHSVIVSVTNYAGTTTKTTAFNKVESESTFSGLKLGYSDDTWDSTITENRLYEDSEVEFLGHTYKSFEDKTPYDTEGEVVTGGLLASVSRGILNASSANTTRGNDGAYTETSANGVSILSPTGGGYVETFSDRNGNTLTKRVIFDNNRTLSESITYTRAGE